MRPASTLANVRSHLRSPQTDHRKREIMNRIAGKRVLITGSSAGIGEACARHFAERGAHLLLSARRAERVEGLAAELAAAHGIEARADALDVTDREAVFSYVAQLEADGVLPDILVNNAGKARGLAKERFKDKALSMRRKAESVSLPDEQRLTWLSWWMKRRL